MTFVSSPNAGQSLGSTRDQVRINTDDLRSAVQVNHVDINDAVNRGKHKFAVFPVQTVKPIVAAATEVALYSKLVASIPRLFLEDAAGAEQQISGAVTSAVKGETVILGGIGIKWGTASVPGPVDTFITPFTTFYAAVASYMGSGGGPEAFGVTGTINDILITPNGPSSFSTVFYIAIGKV